MNNQLSYVLYVSLCLTEVNKKADRDDGEHGLHDSDCMLPVVIRIVMVVHSHRHDPATQRLFNIVTLALRYLRTDFTLTATTLSMLCQFSRYF